MFRQAQSPRSSPTPAGFAGKPRGIRAGLTLLAALGCVAACDGTLSGFHHNRGVLPVVDPEPVPSAEPSTANEPKTIRAQHMVVMHRDSKGAAPTITRSREEARARAEEALAKIQQGANPDEIFGKYSDEPGAAERNGDLGPFSRKQMVKKFSDVAFKLKVGELSGIVETEFGFHIIRRTE